MLRAVVLLSGLLSAVSGKTELDAKQILDTYARVRSEIRGFTVSYKQSLSRDFAVTHRPHKMTGQMQTLEEGVFSQDYVKMRTAIRPEIWGNQVLNAKFLTREEGGRQVRQWADNRYFQYGSTRNRGVIGRTSEYTKRYTDNPVNLLACEFPGHEALGYFSEDSYRIDEKLGKATVTLHSGMESVGPSRCYALDGDTPYGRITAWFDPEKGYALVKYVVELTEEDLFQNRPIGAGMGAGATGRIEVTIDELVQVGGAWVPSKAQSQQKFVLADGDYMDFRRTVEMTGYRINPDFEADGTFALRDIPDDSTWTFADAQGIAFRWNGGKLDPLRDGAALAEINRSVKEIQAAPKSWQPLSKAQAASTERRDAEPTGTIASGTSKSGVGVRWAFTPLFLVPLFLIPGYLLFVVLRRRRRNRGEVSEA